MFRTIRAFGSSGGGSIPRVSSTQEPPSAEDRRLSFGSRARNYDRFRPSFPSVAISWGLGDEPATVAELGAGTGLMTQVLFEAGHRVVAIEPDPLMRDQLRARLGSSVDLRAGSAEAIPLADSAVDAVVAAESFHWFDRGVALAEMARVIRPGGTLLIVWNLRNDDMAWVREMARILAPIEPPSIEDPARTPDLAPWFTSVEDVRFPYVEQFDERRLVGLVDTFSYVADSPQRDRILAQVAELARRLRDASGRDTFDLPFRTRVIRARLSADGRADPP
jgi:SAM-dependent methyltransferase